MVTITTTAAVTADNRLEQQKNSKRLRTILSVLLVVPYPLGLIWTSLHPLVSIATGELKCRGSYIDENGLDVTRHRTKPYPTRKKNFVSLVIDENGEKLGVDSSRRYGSGNGLCDALYFWVQHSSLSSKIGRNVSCFRHPRHFDVVKVVPSSNPTLPNEAVSIIISSPHGSNKNWFTSDVHYSILTLIDRLSNPKKCPWLAKVVFIVSPRYTDISLLDEEKVMSLPSLEDTVSTFLDAYLGVRTTTIQKNEKVDLTSTSTFTTTTAATITPLPPSFSSDILRTVLVINVDKTTPTTTSVMNITASSTPSSPNGLELNILPQGKRGLLPNLDLVFATLKSFDVSTTYNSDSLQPVLGGYVRVHPYGKLASRYEDYIRKVNVPLTIQKYGVDLLGMILFMKTLVIGPYPPHAPILFRGIDSLTIEVQGPGVTHNANDPSSLDLNRNASDIIRSVEHMIRALSNLHERLHHSVNQYILPSSTKFVSNGEYLYPAVLLLIPLAARAVSLAFCHIDRFCFRAVFVTTGTCFVTSAALAASTLFLANDCSLEQVSSMISAMYVVGYTIAFSVFRRQLNGSVSKTNEHEEEKKESEDNVAKLANIKKSIQFVACLTALYLHVPLVLAHVSLGYPSALFWTPVLSFAMYGKRKGRKGLWNIILSFLATVFLGITWPPIWIVPNVFHTFTAYVLVVYTPLHLFLVALWLF